MHQLITHTGSRWAAVAMIAAITAGCATIPEPLAGDYPELQPDQATERSVGAKVRWGGNIVDTRPGSEQTCVEILAHELDRNFRPVRSDATGGRFLACRKGFQDPAVFESGRDITVVGRLTDFVEGEIGEFRYTYPRLNADILFLWADRPDYYADPWWYYDPWWPYGRFRGHYYPRTRFSGHIIIGGGG